VEIWFWLGFGTENSSDIWREHFGLVVLDARCHSVFSLGFFLKWGGFHCRSWWGPLGFASVNHSCHHCGSWDCWFCPIGNCGQSRMREPREGKGGCSGCGVQGGIFSISGSGAGGGTLQMTHLGMCLIWGAGCGASGFQLLKIIGLGCIHGAGVSRVLRSWKSWQLTFSNSPTA